jgi:predicted metalloprotease with PDZ domain
MCIDIIIREKSDGQRGILDLMQKLTNEFGPKMPFNDSELFAKITALTYPEVGAFLTLYVAGEIPIPYDFYLAKVGVSYAKGDIASNPFLNGKNECLTADAGTKEIKIVDTELTDFLQKMGFKANDVILGFNGKDYNLDTAFDLLDAVTKWKEGDMITAKIKRDGKLQTVTGKYTISYVTSDGLITTDTSKENLKQAWLKG